MSAAVLPLIIQGTLALLAGMVAGFIHFRSLWWNTRMLSGSGPILPAVAVQLGRFALLAAVLTVLTMFGAVPLLTGALGIMISRQLVMKRVGAAT